MLAEVANYANNAAAVEKSLRLLQALVQIAAGTASSTADAKTWSTARGHFALTRRYLRLFKWIDFSQLTLQSWASEQDPSRRILKSSKNALLGLYFFMEMFCIVNEMGITASPFLDALQDHALQVWFFAISVSLMLTFYDFLTIRSVTTSPTTNTQLSTSLLVDACDILIPGSAVGWISASSVTVGIASSISSVIIGKQIWNRVQKESRELEARRKEKMSRKVRFGAGTKASEDEKEEVRKVEKKRTNGSAVALENEVNDVKKRSKKA
ncbi:hypothetical protein E4T39_08516 [Aureobasidium subglaciale]|nr:hypothetical protein E4T39_08516 [Aureobasidium subglaciale]